uniref:major histocompatibility complex class I-related gene protein-like n=1 Tax=Pristiophorus japonicus TaxID=55135 RepID=UPI00398F8E1F
MLLILLSTSLCFSWVSPESHSLMYYYTSMSGSAHFPEFIHVGVLDGVQITYYDSITRRDIPCQPWMNRESDGDYWNTETQRLIDRQKLSLANVRIATRRTKSNETGLNFLQYTSGCTLSDNGKVSGVRQYAFNGRDLISFDLEYGVWVTASPAAQNTKHKWNTNKADNRYKQHYTKEICIEWLKTYLRYGAETLGRKVVPEVMVYAKMTPDGQNRNLHCLATGFYPQSINVTWIRDGEPIASASSSGILPNHDGTFQIKISLLINPEDKHQYICRVTHSSLSQEKDIPWDEDFGFKLWMIILVLIPVLIGGLVLLVYKRREDMKHAWCFNPGDEKNYSPTPSTDSSQSLQSVPNHNKNDKSVQEPLV